MRTMQREPVHILKNGKLAAVAVPIELYKKMVEEAEARRSGRDRED